MLGLLAMALTAFMIYTLVRNALVGIQLSGEDHYNENVELIIPITTRTEFYLEPWLKSLESFKSLNGRLKIHLLVDGHHPAMVAWQEVSHKLPYVELHSFPMRPEGTYPVPWMINQVAPQIISQVVIIGDAELVPTEGAFLSLSKLVQDKQKPFFVLPQTERISTLGEAVALLNPTLALASVFGFRKYRRNLSHPLMSIAQGWIGMPLKVFKNLDLGSGTYPSWKQAVVRKWDVEKESYGLAFGEKHLKRHYPEDIGIHIQQLKIYWEELWSKGDRTGLWLFALALFIWSFPVICFFSHPFWALAMIALLAIYRFFSKIVFQESLAATILHPIACIVWIGTFIWWGLTGLKSRWGSQGPVKTN